MRVGYLECFAGVSGDMMLGALVDAGVSRGLLERAVQSLGVGAELRFTRVDRSGISATKVDVLVGGIAAEGAANSGEAMHRNSNEPLPSHEHAHPHTHEPQEAGVDAHYTTHEHASDQQSPEHSHSLEHSHEHSHQHAAYENESIHSHVHAAGLVQDHVDASQHKPKETHGHTHGRGLTEIRELITRADLAEDAAALALRTFELLAQSESKIHGVPVETIHFHEVGAVDAIVDIVCSAAGLCSMGVDRWVCSPLNVGGGFIDCAHGRFPVPAPATADLLRGAPTYSSGIPMEMVTPTGAALIRALGCAFEDAPPMRVASIGYGAGTRNPDRFPNVVRLSIGESSAATGASFPTETITVLECAVDDMNPQVLANCAQLALERGALDIMCTSVVMKKGRLGTLITLLSKPGQASEFEDLLFRETSTLGVRVRQEQRVFLDRRMVPVETQYGTVGVKVAGVKVASRGEQFHAQPEFEDCRRLATEAGVPVKDVIHAATIAFADSNSLKPVQA